MAAAGYLRLYSGDDGTSHFEEDTFSLAAPEGEIAGAVLQGRVQPASHYQVRAVPPGWERAWGPSPQRILAVYLSGTAEIESSDGERRRFAAGSVLLAEDTGGRGHRARVVGADPVVVVQILLPTTGSG